MRWDQVHETHGVVADLTLFHPKLQKKSAPRSNWDCGCWAVAASKTTAATSADW